MDSQKLKKAADHFFSSGQLPEALETYTRLCNLKPRSLHAWHMRAAIHGMLGQFQDSALCCEQALSMNSNTAGIYSNYANALIELNRHEDAIQAFRKAIELDPADTDSLNKLGYLYRTIDNLAEAATCFRKTLEINPGSSEAVCHLAQILSESGDISGSIETCEKGLSLEPANRGLLITLLECYFLEGYPDKAHQRIVFSEPLIPNISKALYRLCKRLHDNKQYREATAAIQTTLKVFPGDDYFKLLLADCQIKQKSSLEASATLEELSSNEITLEAQVLLAEVYDNTGQPEKAEHQLTDAVRRFPDEEIPVALLARSLVKSGKYDAAASLLEEYLERHPDAHKILVELGAIMELNEHHAIAEALYKKAISIEPEYAIAYSRLGVFYQNAQRYASAKEYFEKAIHHDPELLVTRCSLAYLHCSEGEYSVALDQYEEVLEIDSHFEAAIAGKAGVLERMGKTKACFELVEPLVEGGSESIHTLLAYAHSCSAASKESSAASLLEIAIGRPDLLPGDRMHACFLLGKLLDRLGKHDQAFLSYYRGNKMNRFPFDRNGHQRFIDAMFSIFSPATMATFPRSGNQTDKPVFIVGMPRSGTTLTEHILASHPGVFGAGELSHIRNIAAALCDASGSKQSFPLCMPVVNQDMVDKFSFEHLHSLESLANGQQFITDKMPSNFMFLGLIELLFPNARILHCVRDPMDTCLSCYFQNFSRGQYFSYNQSDLAFYYNQYKRLMTHWKSILSIPIMDVHYEEMVNDQEHISRKILEFIGLDWHADCLEFHKLERSIRTASYDQVRKPIYRTSVRRWEKYESHLGVLRSELSE